MTLVRILKPLGFEQTGDIVDFRGNLEEALTNGEVEVLEFDPREPVTSQTIIEDEPTMETPIEETPTIETPVVTEAPVVETPVETPSEEVPVEETPITPEPVIEGQ